MSVHLTCPECDAPLTVPDELLGKTLRCKKCRTTFKAKAPTRADDDDDDRPRRRTAVADEPRSRRRDRDEDEDDDRPRRRRDEDDDRDDEDDRPRRKPVRGKAGGKKAKPKHGVGYFLGLAGALVLLAGALTFVAWKAGAFGPKGEKGVNRDDDEQEAYIPPDPRIKLPKGPPAGGNKLRFGSPPPQMGSHVRLAAPVVEGRSLVVSYEFVGSNAPGPQYVVVAVHSDGWSISPMGAGEKETGQLRFDHAPGRRVEVWIGKVGPGANLTDPGQRVSNVVTAD